MIFMQPIPFPGNGQISFVAAPFIGINVFHQSGAQGIPVDISNRLQQVAVRIDEDGVAAPSEKLTAAVVAAVVSPGVYPV